MDTGPPLRGVPHVDMDYYAELRTYPQRGGTDQESSETSSSSQLETVEQVERGVEWPQLVQYIESHFLKDLSKITKLIITLFSSPSDPLSSRRAPEPNGSDYEYIELFGNEGKLIDLPLHSIAFYPRTVEHKPSPDCHPLRFIFDRRQDITGVCIKNHADADYWRMYLGKCRHTYDEVKHLEGFIEVYNTPKSGNYRSKVYSNLRNNCMLQVYKKRILKSIIGVIETEPFLLLDDLNKINISCPTDELLKKLRIGLSIIKKFQGKSLIPDLKCVGLRTNKTGDKIERIIIIYPLEHNEKEHGDYDEAMSRCIDNLEKYLKKYTKPVKSNPNSEESSETVDPENTRSMWGRE